jgi:predicted AAA+ superfamily ATPase
LVDAKILYECKRFDMKSKKSLKGDRKFYLSDLSFYFSINTDNRINYGPTLENMVYLYVRSHDYTVSIGRIGKLECDFILRDNDLNYSYVQVAYTILASKETEDREYRSLEQIKDNYPKYVATTDYLLQKRKGIKHINIIEFMKNCEKF